MKTIFRFLSMVALVGGIAVTGALAQNVCDDLDGATAKYEAFTANYQKKDVAGKEAALAAGKEFLEKWGACESWAEQVKFVKPWIGRLETQVAALKEEAVLGPLFTRYDAAINSDNADELYSAGKAILEKQPDNINIIYPMAVIGPREIAKGNNKYNAESLRYAKMLYDKLKSNVVFTRKLKTGEESIGVLKYEKTRPEAMSELTYTLAYVNFYGQKNMKAGIPYYYEATQLPGFFKTYPAVYASIGDYYVAEAAPIGAEIAKLIEAIKAAPTDEEKAKIDEQVKAKVALFNGYTERAMDAYGRAWSYAKSDTPALKTYKDKLMAVVQDLYKRRFDKDAGVNEWVATAVAKPLPDPTSAVQPVIDEPTTTTTSAAPSGTGVGAANGTGVAGKPAGAAPTKPVVAKKP
jgi:hypothetical protein